MEDNKDNTELNKNDSNNTNVTEPSVVAPEATDTPQTITNTDIVTTPDVEPATNNTSETSVNAVPEASTSAGITTTPSVAEGAEPETTVESVQQDAPAPTVLNPSLINSTDQASNPSVLAIANDSPHAPGIKKGIPAILISAVLLIIGLAIGFAAAGLTGFSLDSADKNKSSEIKAPVVVEKELTVPKDATVIAECAKGRGKQYVLPKDIPQGPVYNVWNDKVIGIEYMLGQKDVALNKDFLDLPLENVKYDHINIGLLSKGHSGFPEPHYHVDVFTISHAEASKITCQ